MKWMVEMAEQDLDKAMATLKQVNAQRDSVKAQLFELESYLNEYVASITTSGRRFLPIQLQTTQAFMDKLKQAIDSQTKELAGMDEVVEKANAQWLEKKIRHSGLLKVYEKLHKQDLIRQDKREQKFMDDLAAQKFTRSNGS
jgi:flagellar FliJ protein